MSDDFGSKQLIRGTAVTSLLTVVSRILGFFRDLIVALVFGAGPLADAYFVAFRIPNLLRSFVAEGALSSAFVPIFSSESKKSPEAAQLALRSVTTFLILTTTVLAALGILYASQLVDLIAPGFAGDQRNLCIQLTRIMLPYIIFISLIAMINGALTSLKIFGAAAAAQSIMNLVLIAGGIISAFVSPENGVVVLSVSVLAGGVIQVLWQLPALSRAGLTLQTGFVGSGRIIGELLRLMAPALIGATVYQLIIFSATVMASLLEPGAVSWLFYADRIVQLPIGIFSIALGSVLLPALASNMATSDHRSFSDNLLNSLRYTSFILLPLTVLIFFSAPDLIALLFERGAFDSHSSAMTAAAVRALSLGIWAISCQSLLMRAFIARRDNVTPTLLGMLTLSVNVVLSLMLMGPIVTADSSFLARTLGNIQQALYTIAPSSLAYGHVGLALASSAASGISFIVIALVFGRGQQQIGWSVFTRSTLTALLSAVSAGAAGISVASLFPGPVMRLATLGCMFALVYPLVAWLLQSRESREILTLIASMRSRRRP